VPEGLSLTQTIKHRDERGRLLKVERRTTIGTAAAAVRQPVPVHIERLNGVFRDRLAALMRKTTRLPRPPRPGMRCLGCRYSSTTGCGTIRH
jgi:hypothetical protein